MVHGLDGWNITDIDIGDDHTIAFTGCASRGYMRDKVTVYAYSNGAWVNVRLLRDENNSL